MFSLYKTLKRLAVLSDHPVGEIYMTTDNNFNPQTTWGGTWEKITDRFLVGAGSSYSIGSVGGEATHKLTTAEMPSHTHATATTSGNFLCDGFGGSSGGLAVGSGYAKVPTTNPTGGGGSHNNMPPYLAVNMWRRTA